MFRSAFQVAFHPNTIAGLAISAVLAAFSADAQASLILGSTDAASEYPSVSEAMFRTADAVTTTVPNINTRGVRASRIQSQTFKVTQKFAVESIFIGYQWNGINNPQNWPVSFRVIEVNDIGAVYDPGDVTSLTGAAYSTPVLAPNGTATNAFLTMRLDWTGAPLILGPRNGQEGYAIEFVGSGGDTGAETPIGIVFRTNNPAPDTRALEFSPPPALTPSGPNSSGDFIIAITGRLVPEPSACMLLVVVLIGSAAVRVRSGLR